jgi:endonuclease YncB( thermonuclease family)
VVPLFLLSIFFTVRVEQHRALLAKARLQGRVEDGAKVHITGVVDGDEVTVQKQEGEPFVVRILGIKSFDTNARLQGTAEYGERAVAVLKEQLNQEVVLRFSTFKTDKAGRVLAYLEIAGKDLGAILVERGWALTYTRYPFERMEGYLQKEEKAIKAKRGLWGSPRASQRARAMKLTWEAMSSDL